MFCYVFFFVNLVLYSSGAVVKWLPNASFNSPIYFEDQVLPCSKQTVVFPDNLQGSVQVEDGTSVGGFILPENGEIFLPEGTIFLGEDVHEANCTNSGNAFFLDKSTSSWADPDVWSSARFNKATPDSERLPCFDDTVEFPVKSTFTIELPDRKQEVRKLKLEDIELGTTDFILKVLTQNQGDAQKFEASNSMIGVVVSSKPCGSRSGCSCQKNPLKIDCSLKYCSVPLCEHPIQPAGHCCKVCGGELIFSIFETFNMHLFQNLVETIVNSYDARKLDYHIGRLVDNEVQLIVVDKKDYEGMSAQAVNAVDHALPRHWVQGLKEAQLSGSPLSKSGLGGKIFVSVFFAVSLLMGAVYLYYYMLPSLSLLDRGRAGMMTRFHRRTDSVVSLTRRDSVNVRQDRRTAFRNPLYDSKRGKVNMEESAMDH